MKKVYIVSAGNIASGYYDVCYVTDSEEDGRNYMLRREREVRKDDDEDSWKMEEWEVATS